MSPFRPYALGAAPVVHPEQDPFNTVVRAWKAAPVALPDGGTHMGFVAEGVATLDCASGVFDLRAGMYFSAPGPATVRGGCGVAIERPGWHGVFLLGGPIEGQGRLRYVDGCTDSLLIPPVIHGDPCLNYLHIPPGTRQSSHTHPSLRVGVIMAGHGRCVTPGGVIPLTSGTVFVLDAETEHCFHTDEAALVVIAYHPDSDCGPTHVYHPMMNRTFVNGVPASLLPELHSAP